MMGCFGKVPADADFVSLNGALDEVCEFDLWLQSGLVQLQEHESWRGLFDRLPVCFFSYRGRSGTWLLGGFTSSKDASGRRYPFMIFQSISAEHVERVRSPHTLCELFAEQIKPLLVKASRGGPPQELFTQVNALRPWSEEDLDLFQRVHEKFLNDFNMRDVVLSLQHAYPEFIGNATLHRLLGLRETTYRNSPLAIRLPLPAEQGLKRPVADLWCTWVERLSGGKRAPDISVLIDDFMRPALLCFPTREVDSVYRVLTDIASREERYDVLEPFEVFNENRNTLVLPSEGLSLRDFMDCFDSALGERRV
ncbi:MAG: Type secretion system protein ImpM [Pseudomonas sp.]|nr:Type secretion system protein ImpM [Pseudomonas sp.]